MIDTQADALRDDHTADLRLGALADAYRDALAALARGVESVADAQETLTLVMVTASELSVTLGAGGMPSAEAVIGAEIARAAHP